MPPGSDSTPPSAGDHGTTQVPTAAPAQTVAELRRALEGRSFDSAVDVAVLDSERLVGLLSVEALIASDPGAAVADVADPEPVTIDPGASQEMAASLMAEHQGRSIALIDGAGRFRGLIPPRRMLGVLLEEHEEDLARIGGFRTGSGRARQAAEESVGRRLRHRIPWLLLGLVGAMGSAIMIGSFEATLDENVVLAFFVPAIVYMADAVGTQTEAILIRGLAVGVAVRDVAFREITTGAITGALVGVAFIPFVIAGWSEPDVAVAVALALFASCSIATVVAMALPWLFQRLGKDPAFGSGPVATVIQDLLSIAVYLAIAIPIAT